MRRPPIPEVAGLNIAGPARFGCAVLASLTALLTAAAIVDVPRGLHLSGHMTGHMTGANTVDVRHDTGGLVDGIHVTAGSMVKAGDLLVSLDTKALGARIAAMKLEAEAAQSQIGALKSEAFALLQSSEAQTGGRQKLVEIERKVAAVEIAAVTLDARIEAAERDLANRHIRAPIAGRVTAVAVASPGAELAPLQTSVSIEPHGRRFALDAPLNPSQRASVTPGTMTTLRSKSLSTNAFATTAALIETIGQTAAGTPETIQFKAVAAHAPASALPAGRMDLFVETGRGSLWRTAAPIVLPHVLSSYAGFDAGASASKDRLP